MQGCDERADGFAMADFSQCLRRGVAHGAAFIAQREHQGLDDPRIVDFPQEQYDRFANLGVLLLAHGQQRRYGRHTDGRAFIPGLLGDPIVGAIFVVFRMPTKFVERGDRRLANLLLGISEAFQQRSRRGLPEFGHRIRCSRPHRPIVVVESCDQRPDGARIADSAERLGGIHRDGPLPQRRQKQVDGRRAQLAQRVGCGLTNFFVGIPERPRQRFGGALVPEFPQRSDGGQPHVAFRIAQRRQQGFDRGLADPGESFRYLVADIFPSGVSEQREQGLDGARIADLAKHFHRGFAIRPVALGEQFD